MRICGKPLIIACLALCLVGLSGTQSLAYRPIANAWKAQYVDVCPDLLAAADDCSLCHQPNMDRNPYGSDVAQANENFLAIEGLDSDGDGRTNGQEINQDCTLPGDSDSVPVSLTTWSHIKALYR
jgi:hypothetical protein